MDTDPDAARHADADDRADMNTFAGPAADEDADPQMLMGKVRLKSRFCDTAKPQSIYTL